MSDLITNTSTAIIPPQEPAQAAGTFVSGFTLDLTVFILGTALMLMAGYLLFIYIFGQPMMVAKNAAAKGSSMIQHFNTPKSAIMKLAKVSGGAFQYENIRDGTVAATPDSVTNRAGRQLVFTYAQLGITLPPKLLAGVSVLVHDGVNNIKELKAKYVQTIQPVQEMKNEEGETVEVPAGRSYEQLDDAVLIEGYHFEQFDDLLKQSDQERLIPLTIEAVPNFIDRNINADLTEKKLTIDKELYMSDNEGSGVGQMMGIAIAIALILLVQTVIK